MPKFTGPDDIIKHFRVLTGQHAAVAFSSGNPYVAIATKGESVLYMNLRFDGIMYKSVVVRGIIVRFIQSGEAGIFNPPLKVRQDLGPNVYRLAKLEFAFSNVGDPRSPRTAWDEQNITEQFFDWTKALISAAGATAVPDAAIKEILELHLPAVEPISNLFSLDVMEETAAPPAEPVEDAVDTIEEIDDEDHGEEP